ALFGQRGMPQKGVVFGDENVSTTVTVQVDEFAVRAVQFAGQARGEGAEGLPALSFIVLIQARYGRVHDHDVGLTVSGQIHDLSPSAKRDVGLEGNGFEWGELRLHPLAAVRQLGRDRAPVALVVPGASLFGEDAGNAFAMQVGPAVASSIKAD